MARKLNVLQIQFLVTNNVAEYKALILRLKLVKEAGA